MTRENAVLKMTENAQPASGHQEAAAGSKGKQDPCANVALPDLSRTERPVQHRDKNLVQTAGTEQGNKAVQMQC